MKFHSKWPSLHVDLVPSVKATNPLTGEYDESRSNPGVKLAFKLGFAETKNREMTLKALRYLKKMEDTGHKKMFEPVLDAPEAKEEYEKLIASIDASADKGDGTQAEEPKKKK